MTKVEKIKSLVKKYNNMENVLNAYIAETRDYLGYTLDGMEKERSDRSGYARHYCKMVSGLIFELRRTLVKDGFYEIADDTDNIISSVVHTVKLDMAGC